MLGWELVLFRAKNIKEGGILMKVVFIGDEKSGAAEMVCLSVNFLYWQTAVIFFIAVSSTEGLEMVRQESPDAVFIHANSMGEALMSIIQELRDFSSVPVLVLGCGGDEELIVSLNGGADDYMRLPCSLPQLMAQTIALLRRTGAAVASSNVRLSVNKAVCEVFLDGQRIKLSPAEFRVFCVLAKKRDIVVTYQALYEVISGEQGDSHSMNPHSVKKCIQRLRHKLRDNAKNPRLIASREGIGYYYIGPALVDSLT
jgi:DNA-binding response OmpR family regulator